MHSYPCDTGDASCYRWIKSSVVGVTGVKLSKQELSAIVQFAGGLTHGQVRKGLAQKPESVPRINHSTVRLKMCVDD
jgi:hypothetical protein